MLVLNIANQTNPSLVGTTGILPDLVQDIVVVGDYACLAIGSAGLRVIDISSPASPQEVGAYDTPGFAFGLAVAGNYAHIADSTGGLRIADITNLTAPQEIGSYDTPGNAASIALAGTYAYFTVVGNTFGGNSLQVVKIVNPAHPQQVGVYVVAGSAIGVAAAGDRAYLADDEGGLFVFQFSVRVFLPRVLKL